MRLLLAATVLVLMAAALMVWRAGAGEMEASPAGLSSSSQGAPRSTPQADPIQLDELESVPRAPRRRGANGVGPLRRNVGEDEPGAVRGRVVTSTGDPVPGLPLRLQHVAAGDTNGYPVPRESWANIRSEFGRGAVQGDAQTDSEGHFVARGLVPGEYAVRTAGSTRGNSGEYGILLNEGAPARAGAGSRTFILDRHFVVVQLRSPGGAPWAEGVTAPRDWGGRAPASWPRGAHVQVVEAIHGPTGWLAKEAGRPRSLRGYPVGASQVRFAVHADRDYLVSVIGMDSRGDGFDGQPVHVNLGEGEISCRVPVTAGKLNAFGVLDVDATVRMRPSGIRLPRVRIHGAVRRPDPVPFQVDFGDHPDSALQLEQNPSGIVLLEASSDRPSRNRFELPAGEYRLTARADLQRPGGQSGARHGGAVRLVSVAAGRSSTIPLDVGEGGTVIVEVAVGAESVYLELVEEDGRWAPFQWTLPNVNGGCDSSWWWPNGEARESQPVPEGRYRLRGHRGISSAGGTRYDEPITIVDGEVIRVRLE